MSRLCPICPQQPLRVTTQRNVEVELCDRCRGQWLEHGEVERLVPGWDTAPLRVALQESPGRCRRKPHAVPRGQEQCEQCQAPVASCPACGLRLSLVKTSACEVDVCSRCHGLWLDAGELVALRRERMMKGTAAGAAMAAAMTAGVAATAYSQTPAGQSLGSKAAEYGGEVAVEALGEGAEVAAQVVLDGGSVGEAAGAVVEAGSNVLEGVGSLLGSVLEAVGGLLDF